VAINLIIKRFDPDMPFTLPSDSYTHPAGLDIYSSKRVVVRAGTFAQVHTNLAMAIPEDHYGLLLGRSSTFMKLGLFTHPGVIDPDYRGEVMGLVYNPSKQSVLLKQGSKLFQLTLHERKAVTLITRAWLPDSARGEKGIGSSGN
jgi:dUTP pyrophosphatase